MHNIMGKHVYIGVFYHAQRGDYHIFCIPFLYYYTSINRTRKDILLTLISFAIFFKLICYDTVASPILAL